MKAFKFRGADQIPFALDIILKRRLYCSDWRILNDPLEGRFSYSYPTLSEYSGNPLKTDHFDELAEQIVDQKQRKKVCSLSLSAESKLLWAHYASGFTGLAIEVELPDADPRIRRVDYSGACDVDMEVFTGTDSAVTQILSSKFSEWKYEHEVRIIQDEVWFQMTEPVSRVICGPRMNDAMFEALHIVCSAKAIPISRMHLDEAGIDLTGERSPALKLAKALEEKLGLTRRQSQRRDLSRRVRPKEFGNETAESEL
jgi:hypothetical protein